MVGAVHDEFHAGGNLAELSDNQLVADKVVVVRHMAFEFRVRDIGEVPDNDVRVLDGRLDVDFLVVARNRMLGVRIRSVHGTSTWLRW